mmetsp:Transcript_51695/g.134922  ORF Transcript_51695/g.134922 Transcript_51695/m.134922 type:complete len:120 (+) Transcript_51695:132-491(+)
MDVLMHGLVAKRGRWTASYKEQYFVLCKDGWLIMFDRAEDRDIPSKAREAIEVGSQDALLDVEAETGAEGSLSIVLTVRSRKGQQTLQFRVSTLKQQQRWIRAFHSLANRDKLRIKRIL